MGLEKAKNISYVTFSPFWFTYFPLKFFMASFTLRFTCSNSFSLLSTQFIISFISCRSLFFFTCVLLVIPQILRLLLQVSLVLIMFELMYCWTVDWCFCEYHLRWWFSAWQTSVTTPTLSSVKKHDKHGNRYLITAIVLDNDNNTNQSVFLTMLHSALQTW